MAVGDWPALAGGLGGAADPWVERDKLAAGNPVEITGLAQAFAKAAGQAQLATELGRQGSRLTAEGYRVGGMSVHEIDENVARTKRLLGDSGENMTRVATILDGIADDLSTRTTTARNDVTELERQLAAKKQAFAEYEGRYQAALARAVTPIDVLTLIQQHGAEEKKYRDSSVDLVKQYGTRIADSVGDYDAALGKRVRDLADMGYYPPDELAEGPGDIGADPEAGRRDAEKVVEALGRPPGKQSLAEIDAGAAGIAALNDKVAHGGRLTDAERAYMTQFYDTLGADNLARLPQALRDAAPAGADPRRGPDGLPISSTQDVYDSAMAPFRDSLMNLSAGQTDDGKDVRYESMPTAVKTLVDGTNLGVVDPATGLRWPSQTFLDGGSDPRNRVGTMLDAGITGMDRYQALSELTKSTIAPGTATAGHLADAAIRGKQQLNQLQDDARWKLSFEMGGGTDDAVRRLDAMVDDAPASTLLSAAGRNHEASSGLLLDDTKRAQVMGLNWEDGTGAAAVVASGTERDATADPAQQGRAASAALAVVQEVAHDRDGYLDRMNSQVEGAVTDVGSSYLDAFASSPTGTSAVTTDTVDALGRPLGPSFQLSAQDRDHFLQFVSGTGDDQAAEFQRNAKVWAQTGIADALVHGTPHQLDTAMETAGRLDGAVTQANFDYTLDRTKDSDDQAAAAYRAATIDARADQGALNVLATVGKEALNALPLPGGKLVSPLISVGTDIVKGVIGVETAPPPAPEALMPQTKEDLLRADSAHAVQNRDLMLAGAMQAADAFGPDGPPEILTRDADGDGRVDPPSTSNRLQDELGPAVRDGLDRWGHRHAEPGSNGVVTTAPYDGARSTTMSGAWDGKGSPEDSVWRDDRRAAELLYGRGAGPDPAFPPRPTDPRVLDDPRYDRVRNEVREGG